VYVPQTLGLYAGLTVAENWAFTAAAFRTHTAMPADISGWSGDLVGRLPLGAQRHVAFAVANSHQPELLILDEPPRASGRSAARGCGRESGRPPTTAPERW